ncbi:MAG: hypothetical protein F6K11_37525, partial [Leptolyngbya sp. SIO3F4]|nr:hypothetical protein [Leptolyngbya sp. SIO3F4]
MVAQEREEKLLSSVNRRLTEIEKIEAPSDRVKALLDMASEMLPSSSNILQQAFDAAESIQNEASRAKVLSEIVPYFSKSPILLKQALDTAQ